MARKGGGRRTYVRDSNGRFASTPGGGSKKPKAQMVKRGPNRLTRDNAGKITSQGGDGATGRGGRLKTAKGNKRATQLAKLKTMQGVSYGSKRAVTVTPTRLGARINPAKRAIRGATKKLDKAYERENRIRAAYFKAKNLTKKDAIGKELNKASYHTSTMSQQRREVIGSFDVQKKDKAIRVAALGRRGTISKNKDTRNKRSRKEAFKRRIKAEPQVSSARQAATARLKIKTQTRRAMLADRDSVVPAGQRSRLEAGKGTTIKGAPLSSTVAKPRTKGNTKQQVEKRVERKLAATKTNLSVITRYGRGFKESTYLRQLKRSMTLERAQKFLSTGKLPGKDNSIAAQRRTKEARAQLAAKNAAAGRYTKGWASAKRAGPKPVSIGGTKGQPRRPSRAQRLQSLEAKIKAKSASVADELRKVNNAKNRNNDSSWTPRWQKLVQRDQKAQRQARSVMKASKSLNKIIKQEDPGRFGLVRGSEKRKKMATEILKSRKLLANTKAQERTAERAYRESPTVKYGLSSEIGGNRRQSRKAKERASNRQTSIVDQYVGARIAVKQQAKQIQTLRQQARALTQATNRVRRKP